MMRIRGFLGITALSLVTCKFFSCNRPLQREDAVVRIFSDSPLEAEFGKEIRWSFRADINGRSIRIVDLMASRLPFGVSLEKESGSPVIAGRIEGRQFRTGTITAVAFDEKGCREGLKLSAEVASKNAPVGPQNQDLAIPFRECDPDKFQGIPQGLENFYYGKFSWQLVDGVDRLEISDYPSYFKQAACVGRTDCSQGIFKSLDQVLVTSRKLSGRNIPADETIFQIFIPPSESPSTGLMILGNCAKYDRKYCGKDDGCLWTGSVCISSQTTGLSSRTQGAP